MTLMMLVYQKRDSGAPGQEVVPLRGSRQAPI